MSVKITRTSKTSTTSLNVNEARPRTVEEISKTSLDTSRIDTVQTTDVPDVPGESKIDDIPGES